MHRWDTARLRGSVRANASRSVAGLTSCKRSADEAPASARGDDELKLNLEPSVGVDQLTAKSATKLARTINAYLWEVLSNDLA